MSDKSIDKLKELRDKVTMPEKARKAIDEKLKHVKKPFKK